MLNLDFTVAVTQNYVSPANLEAAVQWQALGAGEHESSLRSLFECVCAANLEAAVQRQALGNMCAA